MQTTIRKWGNSLAVRLPQHVVEALAVSEGSELTMKVVDGELIIKRARPRFTLETLLQKHKPAQNHKDEGFGAPVGNEEW
jgi:antitoxin MazE